MEGGEGWREKREGEGGRKYIMLKEDIFSVSFTVISVVF